MKHLKICKVFSLLIALCLLGSVSFACASEAENSVSLSVERLTDTADGAIYRCTAPNGQELYFVANASQEPVAQMEDVNFDGTDDVVVLTRLGASNAYYDLYVWDGQQYVYATPIGGLANYTLDADKGYVVSHANNGLAGMECEVCIYRWEGAELTAVRTLRSETKSEWQDSTDGSYSFAVVYDNRILRAAVTDYTTDVYEGNVIWEKDFNMEADGFDDRQVWDEMHDALTAGL